LKFKSHGLIILCVIALFICISAVSAHGADLTEDTMIMANESNGILAKSIVDDNGFDIKVYKYESDGDVEHQLEHALTNPNKRILAISYQDTVNSYLDEHPELKNRVIVSEDDNESITSNAENLLSIDTNVDSSGDFTTPLIVGLVIGILIGLIAGVFIAKQKN
jgi:hypothetical protein